MKVVTGEEMKEIDRFAIEELEIPGELLMERAGQKTAEAAFDFLEKPATSTVIVLAGTGNNGGDGFVAARRLLRLGVKTEVFLLGDESKIKGEAWTNLEILNDLEIKVNQLKGREDILELNSLLQKADLIVDALLGTGIKGRLRGLYPELIKLVNQVETEVVAVDIPSGVEADTGKVKTIGVKADKTITFALPKLGLIIYPGANYTGSLEIADIGLPTQAVSSKQINCELLTKAEVSPLLPRREPNSHKGDYGKTLILAGSKGMTGAAALTANSLLRAGGGLAPLGVPESLNPILEAKLTEVMTTPLPETEGSLSKKAFSQVEELAKERDLLVVGPGMGRLESTAQLVSWVLELEKPLVLDADGLNAVADLGLQEKLANRENEAILTPHPGELARLSGRKLVEIEANRIEVAAQFAKKHGVVLVLKGARTVIAAPGGELYLNWTGNSGLATGGSGDVLTGFISGMWAQGLSAIHAALVGVYLHGKAADLAAKDWTEYSLLPTDLCSYLPKAIKKIN